MGTIFMEGGTKNFYYGKITQLSTTKFKTFFNDNTIETFQLVPRGDGLMAERNNRPLHFVRFPSMVLASTYATAFNQVMSGGGIVKDAAAAGLAAVTAAATPPSAKRSRAPSAQKKSKAAAEEEDEDEEDEEEVPAAAKRSASKKQAAKAKRSRAPSAQKKSKAAAEEEDEEEDEEGDEEEDEEGDEEAGDLAADLNTAEAAAAEAEVGKVAILPLYKNGANFLSGKGTGYSAKLKLFRLVYGNAKPKEGIQYKFNLIYTTHTFPAWLEYRQVQRKVEMYVKAEDRHVLQSCVRAREGDLSVSVGTPKAETALRFKLTAVKTVSLAIVV